jgi:ribosomal protein S18 acetylase RimI-like enzyme
LTHGIGESESLPRPHRAINVERGKLVTTDAVARRERSSIVASETVDRTLLRAFLETDRLFAAYALCDLDDREFQRTRWGVALGGREPIAVVLQYAGYSPQPVFVMGQNAGIKAILRDVIRPRTAFLAARPEQLPAFSDSYRVDPGPEMLRMWTDRAHFRPFPADVQRLLPVEIGELNRLYQLGFASWLPASAIADGLYYGIRVGGRLVSAAGTHVISPAGRLAVVGNVMTHSDFRGRGYATAVTGAVTAELLRFCDQVVLNVRADNPPALAAYRRLGFMVHTTFEERLIHRSEPVWSGWTGTFRRVFASLKES